MWGFTHLTVHSSYVGGLLPWITVLSLGVGLLFIPLTMAATHGVRAADSGAAAAVEAELGETFVSRATCQVALLTNVFQHGQHSGENLAGTRRQTGSGSRAHAPPSVGPTLVAGLPPGRDALVVVTARCTDSGRRSPQRGREPSPSVSPRSAGVCCFDSTSGGVAGHAAGVRGRGQHSGRRIATDRGQPAQ